MDFVLKHDGDKPVRKYFKVECSSFNRETMSMHMILTSDLRDRYGEVVEPDGMHMRSDSVIMLYDHGHDPNRARLPIGRVRNIKPEVCKSGARGLGGDCYFYQPGKGVDDKFPALIADMYEQGIMEDGSIGFQPDAKDGIKIVNTEDTEGNVTDQTLHYVAWEFLEMSLVTIGANPDAMAAAFADAKAKGLVTQTDIEKYEGKRCSGCHKPEGIEFGKDTITIDGLCYSRELFKAWAGKGEVGLALNQPFELVNRDNGVITIHRIDAVPDSKAGGGKDAGTQPAGTPEPDVVTLALHKFANDIQEKAWKPIT